MKRKPLQPKTQSLEGFESALGHLTEKIRTGMEEGGLTPHGMTLTMGKSHGSANAVSRLLKGESRLPSFDTVERMLFVVGYRIALEEIEENPENKAP